MRGHSGAAIPGWIGIFFVAVCWGDSRLFVNADPSRDQITRLTRIEALDHRLVEPVRWPLLWLHFRKSSNSWLRSLSLSGLPRRALALAAACSCSRAAASISSAP